MRFYTHALFSLLAGLLLISAIKYFWNQTTFTLALIFFVFMIGSFVPDVDIPESKVGQKVKPLAYLINLVFGHRHFFHSLLLAGILSAGVYLLAGLIFAAALFLGFFSHILLDMLTPQGIKLLYPFSEHRISGFIQTGSILEHVLLAIILISLASFVIMHI